MTSAPAGVGDVVRRRAVVVAATSDSLDLRWTEARCRGCVGCGGRCGLFASNEADTLTLPGNAGEFAPGATVDVELTAAHLRSAAGRAYGVAIAAVLLGVVVGHLLGGWVGRADATASNVGALCGLLLGTFLAGRLTKRLDAPPPLRVRHCPASDTDNEDAKELP